MAERDLKLNSLGRYGKGSSRLVLEEHGHCEVPAGCGGAVLRWRNPNAGLLFLVQLFVAGPSKMFIDGREPASGRPLIPFGDHVVSIAADELIPGSAAMAFSAIHDESQPYFPRVSQPSGFKVSILSAPDGSWKHVTAEPAGDTWMRPGFDDSHWPALGACEAPSLDQKEMSYYRLQQILKSGAVCLGIEGPSSRVWIRKSFNISHGELPGAPKT